MTNSMTLCLLMRNITQITNNTFRYYDVMSSKKSRHVEKVEKFLEKIDRSVPWSVFFPPPYHRENFWPWKVNSLHAEVQHFKTDGRVKPFDMGNLSPNRMFSYPQKWQSPKSMTDLSRTIWEMMTRMMTFMTWLLSESRAIYRGARSAVCSCVFHP